MGWMPSLAHFRAASYVLRLVASLAALAMFVSVSGLDRRLLDELELPRMISKFEAPAFYASGPAARTPQPLSLLFEVRHAARSVAVQRCNDTQWVAGHGTVLGPGSACVDGTFVPAYPMTITDRNNNAVGWAITCILFTALACVSVLGGCLQAFSHGCEDKGRGRKNELQIDTCCGRGTGRKAGGAGAAAAAAPAHGSFGACCTWGCSNRVWALGASVFLPTWASMWWAASPWSMSASFGAGAYLFAGAMALIWPQCSVMFGGGRGSGSCAWCCWWHCCSRCCDSRKRRETDELTRFLGTVATYRASSARISAVSSTVSWVASALLTLIHMSPSLAFFTLQPEPNADACGAGNVCNGTAPAAYRYNDLRLCGYTGVQGVSIGLWDACLWQPFESTQYAAPASRTQNIFGSVSCRPISGSGAASGFVGYQSFAGICTEQAPLGSILAGFRALAIIASFFGMVALTSATSASSIPGLPSSRRDISQFVKSPLGYKLFYRHEQAVASRVEALSSLLASLVSAACCTALVLMLLPQTGWLPADSPLTNAWRVPLAEWLPATAPATDPYALRWQFTAGVCLRMIGLSALLHYVTVVFQAAAYLVNESWARAIEMYVKTHQKKQRRQRLQAGAEAAAPAVADVAAVPAPSAPEALPAADPAPVEAEAGGGTPGKRRQREAFGPLGLSAGAAPGALGSSAGASTPRASRSAGGRGGERNSFGPQSVSAPLPPMGFGVSRLLGARGRGKGGFDMEDWDNVEAAEEAGGGSGGLSPRTAFAPSAARGGAGAGAGEAGAFSFSTANPLRAATAGAGASSASASTSTSSSLRGTEAGMALSPGSDAASEGDGNGDGDGESEYGGQVEGDTFGLADELGRGMLQASFRVRAAPRAHTSDATAVAVATPVVVINAAHSGGPNSHSGSGSSGGSGTAGSHHHRMGALLRLGRSARTGRLFNLEDPAAPAPSAPMMLTGPPPAAPAAPAGFALPVAVATVALPPTAPAVAIRIPAAPALAPIDIDSVLSGGGGGRRRDPRTGTPRG